MSFELERLAIGTEFETLWVSGGKARTPIAWENKQFTPPNKAAYVRLTVRNSEGLRLTFGDLDGVADYRYPGIVFVQVFVPEDTGDKDARKLADAAAAIFRSKTLNMMDGVTLKGVIRMRTPRVDVIGARDGYFQMNVMIPYVRDEVG